ncbi:hypothetical protein UlMin_007890 [Ulmus minor]
MRCVRSVSYSFQINRQVHGVIIPKRSLRQWDPLSPYLFVIYSHNDSLILCTAKTLEAIHLKSRLNSYAKASGQLINFDKSALSFSPNTKYSDNDVICSIFGVNQVQNHELYLGIPIFSMRNKRIQFGYVRDRVIRKIQGWKEKTFLQGGREVLLKSVVQSIPTYTMSCLLSLIAILKI